MDTAVNDINRKEMQEREEHRFAADFSPASGFFFTSPFRSLTTTGCFSRIRLPAADGADLNGEFQRSVRQAFAEARQAGIKKPLLCGAIPFDTRQPSALFIPQQSRWFDRAAFMAGVRPAADGPELTGVTELPQQQPFMNMVSDAVDAMKAGELDKVVLSRLLEIETRQPVDRHALMARVIAQNPHGFHFHVPLEQGALLGASPELLLRQDNGRFYSNPLAGSARREADPQRDREVGERLMASAKDRHEHRIVTESMRDVLAGRCRYLNVPHTPELLTTTTLWHLSTPIDGEAASPDENALSLACLLHPTPALCGMPTAEAHALIGKLEPFDRGLFGGIVGWCDDEGNGEWVVTIRCGTVDGNRVRLFAGAGIVEDSSPESEWHETGTKLSTILRAFGMNQG
jgi:isochorismate synthase